MAGDAITRHDEVAAALDLLERLVVFRSRRGNCTSRADHERQSHQIAVSHADTSPALAGQICTSGPGLFRYWFMIASAAQ